jgi:hypothetical protein
VAEEVSGTAGSLGGEQSASEAEYGRFQRAVGALGYRRKDKSEGAFAGNIEKLNKDLDKLVGSSGVLSKLTSGMEKLLGVVNKTTGALGGGGGGSGGSSTNPHAGFTTVLGAPPMQPGPGGLAVPTATASSPSPVAPGSSTKPATNANSGFGVTGKELVGAGLTYGLYRFGASFSSRAETSMGLTPGMTRLQGFGGAGLSYGQVAEQLGLRSMSYGTTGPADTLAQASAASRFSGSALGTPQNNLTRQSISALALTNPGMSLEDASSVYGTLRSPQTTNALYYMTGNRSSFVGQGNTTVNPIAAATSIVRSTRIGGPTAARMGPQDLMSLYQPGGKPYNNLLQMVGGDETAMQSILSMAQAQMNFKAKGGTGTLLAGNLTADQMNKQLGMAGFSNDVIKSMMDSNAAGSRNAYMFTKKAEDDIATMINLQRDMRNALDKIATVLAPGGALAAVASGPVGQIMDSPLGTMLLARLALGGGRGAGAKGAGGVLGKLGGKIGLGGAGAAAGGGALATGGLVTGAAAGAVGWDALVDKAEDSDNPLAKAWGWTQKAVPGSGLVRVGAGNLKKAAGWLTGLGDPPTAGNGLGDIRNNTGNPESVDGLKAPFRERLERLFNDNPRLVLNSGYRSVQQQQELWNQALAKYGSASEARKWVAPPGSSVHGTGQAADIGPPSEYGWLKANAGRYGLVNYTAEPWHWELAGASNAGNRSNYGVEPDPSMGFGAASVGGQSSTSTAGLGGSRTNTYKVGSSASSGFASASERSVFESLYGGATEAAHKSFVGSNTRRGSSSSSATDGGTSGGLTTDGGGGSAFSGSSASGTYGGFARDLLRSLGAPVTNENMQIMVAWFQSESGGGGGRFNPLNTTLNPTDFGYPANSASNYNSIGVKNYSSWDQGIKASTFALAGGANKARYAAIVQALMGSDPQAVISGIAGSPWGSSANLVRNVFGDMQKDSGAYDRYAGHGVGDPGGGGGRPSISMSSGPSHSHVHHHQWSISLRNASMSEAELLVRYAQKRIGEIEYEEAERGR